MGPTQQHLVAAGAAPSETVAFLPNSTSTTSSSSSISTSSTAKIMDAIKKADLLVPSKQQQQEKEFVVVTAVPPQPSDTGGSSIHISQDPEKLLLVTSKGMVAPGVDEPHLCTTAPATMEVSSARACSSGPGQVLNTGGSPADAASQKPHDPVEVTPAPRAACSSSPGLNAGVSAAPPSGGTVPQKRRRRARADDHLERSSILEEQVERAAAKGRSGRRRAAPCRYSNEDTSEEELKLLQQAIENSRSEQVYADFDASAVPTAPTFRPTLEQFKDPLVYIEEIRLEAQEYGVVKIIPPAGWNPPALDPSKHAGKRFPTKKQAVHKLQEGEGYGDGGDYTLEEYTKMGDEFKADWVRKHYMNVVTGEVQEPSLQELERDYWRTVEIAPEPVHVDYGNDLDVEEFWSGFPDGPEGYMSGEGLKRDAPVDLADIDFYSRTGWNLNNLAFWPGSVLRFFRTHIQGVTQPWLYLGMLFATFAWHNEDNYLYSINYNHSGAPKQWYGVPGSKAKQFEVQLEKHVRELIDQEPDLLYHITTQMSPVLLRMRKVPVYSLVQEAGEFVVTFPKAYHCGFSYGFNMGEAVNFGSPDWIQFGHESNERYRLYARPSVFSHDRMAFALSMYLPDHNVEGCRAVVTELRRLRDEELDMRKHLLSLGIQDFSPSINLPQFKLEVIEASAAAYDDLRMCNECKHTCFMSAVSCTKCTTTKVVCLRHWRQLCRCPPSNLYFFFWMTADDINSIVERAETHMATLKQKQTATATGAEGVPKVKEVSHATAVALESPGPKSTPCSKLHMPVITADGDCIS